jgi:hypothetical protein
MNNIERKKFKNSWLLLLLLPLLISLLSFETVFAGENPKFLMEDGKTVLKVKAIDEDAEGVQLDQAYSDKDWFAEFELKDTPLAQTLHPLLLQIEIYLELFENCEDDFCKKHYRSGFFVLQKDLAANGIAINVPKNLNDWEYNDDWFVHTVDEGFINGLMGANMANLMQEDNEKFFNKGDSVYEDQREKAKTAIENTLKLALEVEEKVDKAKSTKITLEGHTQNLKILLTGDILEAKQILTLYCQRSEKDENVCSLLNAFKTSEARKAYIPILTKKIEELERENEEAQKEAEEVTSELDEEMAGSSLEGYEAPTRGSKYLPNEKWHIIAYEGLFTPSYLKDGYTCTEPVDESQFKKGETNGDPTQGKVAKMFTDLISGVAKSVTDVMFGSDCPGIENGGLSVIAEILNITSPLNLTQNYIIMKLVALTQSLAYVLAFVLIIAYGIMYTTGYENMDPVKFGIRMFFALILVNYLPYLMQDILNINNIIVHYISNIEVTFAGGGTSSTVFAGAIKNWIDSMTESLMTNLLTLILLIVMIYLALQPIIKILVWWYTRMLKIFFHAIIGPIMVVMMALPQTSAMATKWLKDFIGETFSQVFMVLAMAMMAFIVGNMADFAHLTNLGWLGTLLVMYAAISFLAEVPSLSSSMIGGIGGLNANKLAGDVARVPKKLGKVAKGAGNSVKNAGGGMMDTARNGIAKKTGGESVSSMQSIKSAKGLSGKLGAVAGAGAAKIATTKTPGKNGSSAHQKYESSLKPKLANVKASREAKKSEKQLGYQRKTTELADKKDAISKRLDASKQMEEIANMNIPDEQKQELMNKVRGTSLNEKTKQKKAETEKNKNEIGNLRNPDRKPPTRTIKLDKSKLQKAKENAEGGASSDSRGFSVVNKNGSKNQSDVIPAKDRAISMNKENIQKVKDNAKERNKSTELKNSPEISIPGEGSKKVPNEISRGSNENHGKGNKIESKDGNNESGKVKGEADYSQATSPIENGRNQETDSNERNINQNKDFSSNVPISDDADKNNIATDLVSEINSSADSGFSDGNVGNEFVDPSPEMAKAGSNETNSFGGEVDIPNDSEPSSESAIEKNTEKINTANDKSSEGDMTNESSELTNHKQQTTKEEKPNSEEAISDRTNVDDVEGDYHKEESYLGTEYYDYEEVEPVKGTPSINKRNSDSISFAQLSDKYTDIEEVSIEQIAKDFKLSPQEAKKVYSRLLKKRGD